MGRQIGIAAIGEDERMLLDFLRSTADIALFETFAPTLDALWVDEFAPEFRGHICYHAWNRAFPWTPAYGEVGPQSHDPACIGWSYVANSSCAPVLEIGRTRPSDLQPGRLYWARAFSAPNGLTYDGEAFSHWIDLVFKGVRKLARKLPGDRFAPYAFPAAEAAMKAVR
jgi:hypothetical protein